MTDVQDRVPARRLRRFSPQNRYGVVVLLILVTYGVSASNTGSAGSAIVVAVQLATLWIIFTVTGSRKVRRIAGIGLILVGVLALFGAILGRTVAPDADVDGFFYAVNTLLYLVAPLMILLHLVRRQVIDVETFLGAIATYLLLGMMFAFAFRTIAHMTAGPFFGTAGDGNMSNYLFFSFVTLTTTGYGDLVPAANPGQSMAVLEAVLGQLFLVTALAKIVTAWTPAMNRGPKSDEDEPSDSER